jgi:S1-C subfamily serine protease
MRWIAGAVGAALLVAAPALAQEALPIMERPGPPPIVAKALDLGAKPRSVSLARLSDSLKHGQNWAILLWGRKCAFDNMSTWDSSKDSFTKDAIVERTFRDELSKLGFSVAGDPNNLFKDREDDGAELQVGALITDVSVWACGGIASRERKLELAQTYAMGGAQMSVEWQVYSPVESRVIAKIPTIVRIEPDDPMLNIVDVVLNGAFAESVKALAASEDFRKAVLSSGPSVSALRKPGDAPPIMLAQNAPVARPLSDASGSVVALFTGDGMGSGFLVSRDGLILTNRHVVGASKYLKVKWSDGVETVGEVIRTDAGRDIALVRTEPRGRQPITLRRGGVQAGESVFAIGTPLDPRLQGSLTQGIVSANRILDGYSFIQSDVVVNPGNSGGPLLNAKGEAVGVTVSGVGQDKAPRGINFFIPIDDALDFLSLKLAEAKAAR